MMEHRIKEGKSSAAMNRSLKLFKIQKHNRGVTLWFFRRRSLNNEWHSRSVSFGNYYGIWSKPNEVSFTTNKAKKGIDKCFDCTLTLGKVTLGYTNWDL